MNTPVDSVTLAELEREFTPAQILGMFAATPDDPKWPLLLAWLAFGKAARLEARAARGVAGATEAAPSPVLAHSVSPVLVSGATPAASDLHDLAADVRATIADLLEAVREANSPDEKALMADAAAKLLAEVKCAAASDAARPARPWPHTSAA